MLTRQLKETCHYHKEVRFKVIDVQRMILPAKTRLWHNHYIHISFGSVQRLNYD